MPATPSHRPPRSLYFISACVGVAFVNFTVGLPLLMVADGRPVAVASSLLATETGATAAGAVLALVLAARKNGGPDRLAVALGLIVMGGLVLAASSGTLALFLGAAVVGLGVGMFWVASQGIMGAYAGITGSERAFLLHYGLFTTGGICGSVLTGLAAGRLEGLGTSPMLAARLTLGVGALVVVLSWVVSILSGMPRVPRSPVSPGLRAGSMVEGLAMQRSDLLLVGGMAMQVPLAPIVLISSFGFSAAKVGAVVAGTGVAKVAGTVVTRSLVRAVGHHHAVVTMLGTGSAMCLLLSVQSSAPAFVVILLVAVGATGGIWPVVVDAVQARTIFQGRTTLAAGWNIREYAVISGMTAAGGWLYATAEATAPLFLLSATLFLLALREAVAVLRLPVVRPRTC